jgi:hypothetical protein
VPPQGDAAQPYPENAPPAYPGMLPPPVQYPKRRRGRLLIAGLVAAAVVAVIVVAIVLSAGNDSVRTTGTVTDASAKTAIQGYLDALSRGDDETIARNTMCGLYDAVKEKRSDLALAGLASDAFRKQFSTAEVTSIDKIVMVSNYQSQVLFTMRTTPAGSRTQRPAEEQGVAQLLSQEGHILVCSYLLRTAGQY